MSLYIYIYTHAYTYIHTDIHIFIHIRTHTTAKASPLETGTPTQAVLSVGDCLCQCSPESPRPQLTVSRVGSQATAVLIAGTMSCLLIY